ncbi:MAG: GGDEF domain-containing protein [Actinobacteria bacterium]|nr:GGDEF domain-containing protein [Actinomycetota bacterium]
MRGLAMISLVTYAFLRNSSESQWFFDVVLFNSAAIFAVLSIFISPIPDDFRGRLGVALAILMWSLGSIASSLSSFFTFPPAVNLDFISDISYALFYPLALLGITRSILHRTISRALELLDSLIITLGFTTIIAAFLIRPAMLSISGSRIEVFLAILYPVGDLVLFLATLTLTIMRSLSWRNGLLLAGITCYTVADLYFLYLSQAGQYQLGAPSDMGWLLAFILIAESYWHSPHEEERVRSFNPTIATMALLGSSAILAIAVLEPDFFPRFIIAPAFATIALSFLRMGVAINDARNMSNEQILARTDELTGLANRRRFMTDFEGFSSYAGSVLILDLDGFKPVNDAHGHNVGDQLLKQVARRFERSIPHGSLLARLGGDEFGALIRGDDGEEVALALRATLSYPFHFEGLEFILGVSVGIAHNVPGEIPTDQLLRQADEAMYEAKRSKSGVCVWSPELGARAPRL